ncbi:MAG: HNH endonuclease [Streptosporangiaceae bacterium]
MPITDRTRKILWARAGGRCSICQDLLVTEGTDTDDPSVFGEESHIVGQSPKGPRASDIADVDGYDNLILLCRKHHKQIDDQVGYYTVERLREIKRTHEEWVASLGEASSPGPVRLVPDPTRPIPKALKIFTTGSSLWRLFDGARAFYPNWPDGLSDEQEDLIAGFFDYLRDWMDVSADVDSFQAKRDAAKGLGEYVKSLAEASFLVGARERYCLLTGGIDAEPLPWRVIDIEVHSVTDAQLADKDGNPLEFGQDTVSSADT